MARYSRFVKEGKGDRKLYVVSLRSRTNEVCIKITLPTSHDLLKGALPNVHGVIVHPPLVTSQDHRNDSVPSFRQLDEGLSSLRIDPFPGNYKVVPDGLQIGYIINTTTAQIHRRTYIENPLGVWTSERTFLTLPVYLPLISGQVVNTFKCDTKEAEDDI